MCFLGCRVQIKIIFTKYKLKKQNKQCFIRATDNNSPLSCSRSICQVLSDSGQNLTHHTGSLLELEKKGLRKRHKLCLSSIHQSNKQKTEYLRVKSRSVSVALCAGDHGKEGYTLFWQAGVSRSRKSCRAASQPPQTAGLCFLYAWRGTTWQKECLSSEKCVQMHKGLFTHTNTHLEQFPQSCSTLKELVVLVK